MEDAMEWNHLADHPRTIIHIDIDCFYAQVEMLKKPELSTQPLGVQQKNIVVTCNYIARAKGVGKCMLVSEAKKLCPELVLVNGQDLHDYRLASNQIHAFLTQFSSKVEKLGFDENYLDVTDIVSGKESECALAGHALGDLDNMCSCGCHERLHLGSQLAAKIREKLHQTLGFTSCCGVSYNKLLAKLAGAQHKPNQQTTLVPNGVSEFLVQLNEVHRIPGIGTKTRQILREMGVRTVKELQEVEVSKLRKVLGSESAVQLKNLSRGQDDSPVKPSGKPQTIGLEDGFRKISLECEVEEKFKILLLRLMTLVEEDGRIPLTVKVTVRKWDNSKKMSHKETKQAPLPGSLLVNSKLNPESTNKILTTIMSLFHRIVNISKPFHLTLLGLAFTKFQEKCGTKTMAAFLLKKHDLSVQSLTSFVSNTNLSETTEPEPCCSTSEVKYDSEPEKEPSVKKTKLDVVIKKRKLEEMDLCSPSKLKVGDLSLSGGEPTECPKDVDPSVFRELPYNLQQELIRDWKLARTNKTKPSSKQSLILQYCIPNK